MIDIEELQTTKTEKLLAVVLAIFLLMGGVWTVQEIDDWVRGETPAELEPFGSSDPAIVRHERAQERLFAAEERLAQAREELELRREAYRTALDAGRSAPALERAYVAAQRAHRTARRQVAAAQRRVQATEPAATRAQQRLAADFDERLQREDRNIFLWRLALVLAGLALSYALLWHLHRRQSRYLALAFAAVVSATLLALVVAGDYITDYVNPLDLGPLILALVGTGLTIAAFVLLQSYLRRRLPTRRVRKRQCPYCGFPSGASTHCEGCGRQLVAECAKCGADRRVGTLHCRACGAM